MDPNRKPRRRRQLEHKEHAELEVEYKTKFGRLKVEGEAKKYCVKPPGGRRICYTPETGIKLGALRRPSVGSILKRIIRRK